MGSATPSSCSEDGLQNSRLNAPKSEEANSYYEFEVEIGGVIEKNRFFIYRHPLELTRPYFNATLANIVENRGDRQTRRCLVCAGRSAAISSLESQGGPGQTGESDKYQLAGPYHLEYQRFFDQAKELVDFPIIDLLPDFLATEALPARVPRGSPLERRRA